LHTFSINKESSGKKKSRASFNNAQKCATFATNGARQDWLNRKAGKIRARQNCAHIFHYVVKYDVLQKVKLRKCLQKFKTVKVMVFFMVCT